MNGSALRRGCRRRWAAPAGADMHIRATTAMHALVGIACAEEMVLPFSAAGRARAEVDDRHLGMLHPQHGTATTRAGAHVKAVPKVGAAEIGEGPPPVDPRCHN